MVEEEQRGVMVIYSVPVGYAGYLYIVYQGKKLLFSASAIAYYPGGRAREMGPLAVLPHH